VFEPEIGTGAAAAAETRPAAAPLFVDGGGGEALEARPT
jgi:hypothetical protein